VRRTDPGRPREGARYRRREKFRHSRRKARHDGAGRPLSETIGPIPPAAARTSWRLSCAQGVARPGCPSPRPGPTGRVAGPGPGGALRRGGRVALSGPRRRNGIRRADLVVHLSLSVSGCAARQHRVSDLSTTVTRMDDNAGPGEPAAQDSCDPGVAVTHPETRGRPVRHRGHEPRRRRRRYDDDHGLLPVRRGQRRV
jgi:hypothetical protein